MKLKSRRMLSVLMAIVMVLTMMPFHPLEVGAAATPTLDLGTPVRSSATNYQLSNAAFGSTGAVDAGGGYFTVAVNNGSIAVGALSGGITELTNGITISTRVTDQSISTNRVFNFSSSNIYEDIQAAIQNMTFTQAAGQTQSVTVNVVPGAPLANGKTSVRTYNKRHFAYVARPSVDMTFLDAMTTAANATSNEGHLVEPTATPAGAVDMLAIARLFAEFKTPFIGEWNFLSFIGATKTTAASNWATPSNPLTRYVSNTNGQATGLESTPEYSFNGVDYVHLTLQLNTSNNSVRYLGVNNTHGGSSIYTDPGVIVEYNPGVINIITATKDVPSFSGVGIDSVTAAVYKSVTASVYNGSSTITATPLDVSTVMSVTYANGDPVTGLRAFDLSGNEITAGVNGWYPSNGSPIVFLPLLPGGTYKVAAAATFNAGTTTPSTATVTRDITLPTVGNNVAVGKDSGHPGQTTITVNPSSTLAKYAVADKNGKVVSGWKTGTGSDLTFDNLNPDTDYQIVAIPADAADPLPTATVSGTQVTTPHNAILRDVTVNDISRVPAVPAGGSDSITVKPTVAGQDYAIFDYSVTPHALIGSWVPATDTSGVTFSGLDPAKTYQVVTRLTGTINALSDGITVVPLSTISATGSIDKSTGDGVITVAPVDPTKQYSLLNSDGTIAAGVAAYDQNGTALTASNGWYHTSTSTIVFKPVVPGGTYKVVTNSNTSTSPDKVAPRQSVAIPVIGDNLTTGLDPVNAGKTSITVNPSSTLAKYAVADENGNVVSGWKTGTGSDLTFDNLNPGTRYQIVTVPADTTDPLPTANVSGTRVLTPVAPVDAKNILRLPTSTAGSDLIHINNTAPAIQYALVDKSTGKYVDVNGNLSTEPVWTSGNGSTLTFQPVDAAKTYQVLARPIPAAGEISPMPTSGTDVLPYHTANLSGGMMYEDSTYPTQATITVAGVTGSVYQYTGKYAVNGVPVGVYPASITIANPDNAALNATFTAIATVDGQGNVTFGPFTPNLGAPAGMSVTSDARGTIIVHPSTAVSQVASNMVAAVNTNTLEALQAAHDEFTALTPEEQLQISRTTVENVSNAILNLLQASLKISSAVSGVANPAATRNQLDNQKGMLLTPAEIAQVLNGQSLNVTLNLNATDVSTSTTPGVSADKSLIETRVASSAAIIGFMYDINITKKVDELNSNGAVITPGTPQLVPVVPLPISITLPIPTNLLGYKYFAIVRVHNGVAEFIPASVNGTTVTFSSTKFSTYALAYSNQMIFADNLPGTGPKLPTDGGSGGGGFVSPTVTIDSVTGGKVTVDNNKATSGTKVTITVTPDTGYSLDKLTITDDKGNAITYKDNGDGTYTYVQPSGTVKINATFKALDKVPAPAADTGVFKLLNTKDHFVYLNGYEDGTFRSDAQVTRDEVAQMFYNLLKNQEVNTSGIQFADVSENAWYAKAVNTLASLGIINGYEDGTFAPNKAITRAEFTIIAVNFSNKAAGKKSFTDVSNTHWAYASIATSAEYGWVNGYPDGAFEPDKTITRAETATIANRMLNRQPDKKAIDASTSIKVFKDLSNGYWAYYDIMEATNAHQYEKSNGKEIWVP